MCVFPYRSWNKAFNSFGSLYMPWTWLPGQEFWWFECFVWFLWQPAISKSSNFRPKNHTWSYHKQNWHFGRVSSVHTSYSRGKLEGSKGFPWIFGNGFVIPTNVSETVRIGSDLPLWQCRCGKTLLKAEASQDKKPKICLILTQSGQGVHREPRHPGPESARWHALTNLTPSLYCVHIWLRARQIGLSTWVEPYKSDSGQFCLSYNRLKYELKHFFQLIFDHNYLFLYV